MNKIELDYNELREVVSSPEIINLLNEFQETSIDIKERFLGNIHDFVTISQLKILGIFTDEDIAIAYPDLKTIFDISALVQTAQHPDKIKSQIEILIAEDRINRNTLSLLYGVLGDYQDTVILNRCFGDIPIQEIYRILLEDESVTRSLSSEKSEELSKCYRLLSRLGYEKELVQLIKISLNSDIPNKDRKVLLHIILDDYYKTIDILKITKSSFEQNVFHELCQNIIQSINREFSTLYPFLIPEYDDDKLGIYNMARQILIKLISDITDSKLVNFKLEGFAKLKYQYENKEITDEEKIFNNAIFLLKQGGKDESNIMSFLLDFVFKAYGKKNKKLLHKLIKFILKDYSYKELLLRDLDRFHIIYKELITLDEGKKLINELSINTEEDLIYHAIKASIEDEGYLSMYLGYIDFIIKKSPLLGLNILEEFIKDADDLAECFETLSKLKEMGFGERVNELLDKHVPVHKTYEEVKSILSDNLGKNEKRTLRVSLDVMGMLDSKLGTNLRNQFEHRMTKLVSNFSYPANKFLMMAIKNYGLFSKTFLDYATGKTNTIDLFKTGDGSTLKFRGPLLINSLNLDQANYWKDLQEKEAPVVPYRHSFKNSTNNVIVTSEYVGLDLEDIVNILEYPGLVTMDFVMAMLGIIEEDHYSKPLKRLKFLYSERDPLLKEIFNQLDLAIEKLSNLRIEHGHLHSNNITIRIFDTQTNKFSNDISLYYLDPYRYHVDLRIIDLDNAQEVEE